MIDFNTFLPHETIHFGGIILLIWVIVGLMFNLLRWRPVLGSYLTGSKEKPDLSSVLRSAGETFVREVFLQRELWGCNALKWLSHFLVFWGFIILGMSTTLNYLMNPLALPLPLSHSVRILGNFGGLLFMIGLTLMLRDRVVILGVRRNTSFGDAFFIALLYAVGLSGFLTEIFSETNSVQLTFVAYWTHMVTVVALFLLIPFSKFIHSLGRSLILLFEGLRDEERGFHFED